MVVGDNVPVEIDHKSRTDAFAESLWSRDANYGRADPGIDLYEQSFFDVDRRQDAVGSGVSVTSTTIAPAVDSAVAVWTRVAASPGGDNRVESSDTLQATVPSPIAASRNQTIVR